MTLNQRRFNADSTQNRHCIYLHAGRCHDCQPIETTRTCGPRPFCLRYQYGRTQKLEISSIKSQKRSLTYDSINIQQIDDPIDKISNSCGKSYSRNQLWFSESSLKPLHSDLMLGSHVKKRASVKCIMTESAFSFRKVGCTLQCAYIVHLPAGLP